MSEVLARVSGGKPVGARPVPGVKGGPRTGQPPGGAKPEGPHPPGPASLRLLRVGERAARCRGAQALGVPDVPAGSPGNPVGLAFMSPPSPFYSGWDRSQCAFSPHRSRV